MPPCYRMGTDELHLFPWDCSPKSRVKPCGRNADVDVTGLIFILVVIWQNGRDIYLKKKGASMNLNESEQL